MAKQITPTETIEKLIKITQIVQQMFEDGTKDTGKGTHIVESDPMRRISNILDELEEPGALPLIKGYASSPWHQAEQYLKSTSEIEQKVLAEIREETTDLDGDDVAEFLGYWIPCSDFIQSISESSKSGDLSYGHNPLELINNVCSEYQDEIDKLKDFAIWMTGCGYEFTKHKYFCEQRDKLLKD